MNPLWVLAVLCVAVGLAGTLLPLLPGPVLVFAGLLIGAWADGFAKVGVLPLVVIGLLTASTFLVDLAATSLGVKRLGASPWAAWGAAIGSVVGFFVGFGLPGLLVGPFVGAFAGELLYRRRDTRPPIAAEHPGLPPEGGVHQPPAGDPGLKRDLSQAGKAGVGTWLGLLLGGVLKLVIVFGMLGVFVLAYVVD